MQTRRVAGKGGAGVRVIAITGGIGAGKSTVAGLYRAMGVPVIDADAISRALTAPGGEALPPLREAFGDAVFHADGTLNRAALARLVFVDQPERIAQLNTILHPRIIRRVREALAALEAAGEAVALLDVPLLYETGMDRLADAVVCVTAPENVRLRRVRGRDRLTREEALRRMQSQYPPQEAVRRADYVLTTNAPRVVTARRARALWRRVLADGPRRTPQP